jgi:hypothetical protein
VVRWNCQLYLKLGANYSVNLYGIYKIVVLLSIKNSDYSWKKALREKQKEAGSRPEGCADWGT